MKEEIRKQILGLRKQIINSDSLKERRELQAKIEMLTETLESQLINSPIKVKISYEITLDFCELPDYDLIVEDFIENGDLTNAIIESAREAELDSDDFKVEIING